MLLYYGLILFFLLEYIRPANYFPMLGILHLNTVVPVSVFLLTAFTSRKMGNVDILRSSNSKWLMFYLLLIVLSVLTADVQFYSFNVLKGVLGYLFVIFIMVKEVDEVRKIKGIFFTLVMVHIVLAILSPDVILHPETRSYIAQGTFLGDGNDFALSVCIAIPFCFFLFLEAGNKFKKILYLVMVVLLVFCVIGSSSRGGSIALACVLLYQWVKSKRKIFGVFLIISLVGAVLIYAPPTYLHRLETLKDYKSEGSAQGRIMAWKSAMRMARDHPFFGVGAGHFAVKYGVEYRPPGYGRRDLPWSNAHSIYFQILGELGIPGIIFLLSILLSNIIGNEKRLRQIERYTQTRKSEEHIPNRRLLICLNASLIAYAVGGAFLSAVYYPHLYVLVGLVGIGQRLFRDSFEKETDISGGKNIAGICQYS